MRWLDGRYRGLITRGRSRRASLDDFCNPCDPQARFPRDRWIPCFPCPRPKSRAGEEQVRAPCGASQPRPFGRGSAVAGTNPAPTLLPPRLLVDGRATPARSWLEHLCREALARRDMEPSRERRTSPDRARFRARRPVAREGRFPWASAKRTHVVAHPRCFPSPGLLLRGWADPCFELHCWRREGIGQALVQSPPDIRCMDDATGWVGTRPMGEQALS